MSTTIESIGNSEKNIELTRLLSDHRWLKNEFYDLIGKISFEISSYPDSRLDDLLLSQKKFLDKHGLTKIEPGNDKYRPATTENVISRYGNSIDCLNSLVEEAVQLYKKISKITDNTQPDEFSLDLIDINPGISISEAAKLGKEEVEALLKREQSTSKVYTTTEVREQIKKKGFTNPHLLERYTKLLISDPNGELDKETKKFLEKGELDKETIKWLDLVNKNANEASQENSQVDGLTRNFNRRYLEQELSNQLGLVDRNGYTFSFIIFDLDHFKSINDIHGHPAGDTILKKVGDLGKKYFRTGDTFARYGGDEFCVILPTTNLEDAVLSAENYRTHLNDVKVDFKGADVQIEASMGVINLKQEDSVFLLYGENGRKLILDYLSNEKTERNRDIGGVLIDYIHNYEKNRSPRKKQKLKPNMPDLKKNLLEISGYVETFCSENLKDKEITEKVLLENYEAIAIYTVIKKADKLLYQSKNKSRNRVTYK